jgi:hypothetical protein
MTRVILHIPNWWPENGFNRTRGALSRMICTDCVLLVSGGRLSNNFGLRDAFVAAGWVIIEDTAEADSLWQEAKAAKLAFLGGGGGPVVTPTITSPVTFDVLVGANYVTPVILDAVISGTNTPVGSFLADYPAHDAGDLLIVVTGNDDRISVLGDITVTGIDPGEVVTQERAIMSSELNTNADQTLAFHSFVANATRTAGNGILVDASGADDQYLVGVIRVEKDTFKDTAPRMGSITKTFENTTARATATAAVAAAFEKARVLAAFNIEATPPTGTIPTGWTQHAVTDIGAIVLQILSRNAETTDGENVPAQTISTSTHTRWVGGTGLILPKGA